MTNTMTMTMTSIFIDQMKAEPDTPTPLSITPARHTMAGSTIHCLHFTKFQPARVLSCLSGGGQEEKIIEMERK